MMERDKEGYMQEGYDRGRETEKEIHTDGKDTERSNGLLFPFGDATLFSSNHLLFRFYSRHQNHENSIR